MFENKISFLSYPPYEVIIRDPVQTVQDLPKNDPVATLRIVMSKKAIFVFTGDKWDHVCEITDMLFNFS